METETQVAPDVFSLLGQGYLGPATVLGHTGNRIRLELPGRTTLASLALAYPVPLEPGDRVLAIGREDVYIIGILSRKSPTLFQVQGDLEISATGKLLLRSREQVQLESPRVAVRADRFETAARVVMERVVDSYRWARGLFQLMAGRTRTVVDTSATLHAGRVIEKAKEDVSIDGKQIRLG